MTVSPENNHLLLKGKYRCMADPTIKSVDIFAITKQLNPN